MSEGSACWSCQKPVSGDDLECPNCGMPLDSSDPEDDLDFLDDMLEETSKSVESESPDDFVLPDMDYVEGKTEETISPKGELDQGMDTDDEFVLPDMDYVEGRTEETISPMGELDQGSDADDEFVIPDMDYVEGKTDVTSSPQGEMDQIEQVESSDQKLSDNDKDTKLADMDSLLEEPQQPDELADKPAELEEPMVPDFPEDLELEEEIEEEADIEEAPSPQRIFSVLLAQQLYWGLIFILIIFATLDIFNQNFNPEALEPSDFNFKPIGFIMAWLAFIPMGWFYGYKLRTQGNNASYLRGILFIVVQVIVFYIISLIGLLLYNPGFLRGQLTPSNYIITSYFMTFPLFYLITGIVGGWFLFFVGYIWAWESIYHFSPKSDLNPSLSES